MEIKMDLIKGEKVSKYRFSCEIAKGITALCDINEDVSLGMYIQKILPKNWRELDFSKKELLGTEGLFDEILTAEDIFDATCPAIMNFIIENAQSLCINAAVKNYAEEILEAHKTLEAGILMHDFKCFQFNVGHFDSVSLTPYVYCDEPKLSSVEYILPHDNNLWGSSSRWKMASILTPSVYFKIKNMAKETHDQLMDVYIEESVSKEAEKEMEMER